MDSDRLKEILRYEADYNPETHFAGGVRESARYAVLLLERAEEQDVARAADMAAAILELQVNNPALRLHGQFPMHPDGPAEDLNAVLFIMPSLLGMVSRGSGRLPDALTEKLTACVKRAVVAVDRRWDEERFDLLRDFKAYTNIFLLYIQALVLAANYFNYDRLARKATAQWQRWFNHVSYYGLDELSPSYSNIDYEALITIHNQAADEQVCFESGLVIDYLSVLYHAITHPVLQLPVCGLFRDYRQFLNCDECNPDCIMDEKRVRLAIREDFNNRSYPYIVHGRATSQPFRFQSWQEAELAMGTMTGGNYFWQQIHCMVAVGHSADDRAVLFMPGQFTPTSGFVAQQERSALCFFSRKPNALHRTQYPMPDHAVHTYQQAFGIGLSENWTVGDADRSGLLLSACGYDVRIQPFVIREGDLQSLDLTPARHSDMGQEGFHRKPLDFSSWQFPDDAESFGCLVVVGDVGQLPDPGKFSYKESNSILTVRTDSPSLQIRLFKQPSGELTELYDDDWRTVPLLESPAYSLNPGELTQLAANRSVDP